jgi:uncharacterized protein GlcG (DUF336 family)
MKRIVLAVVAAAMLSASPGRAEEAIITYKSLAPDIAFDIARAALQQCRKEGYQIAVTVIDRFGLPLVLLRDRFAGSMTMTVAERKARTALNFARDTSALGKMIQSGELTRDYLALPDVVTLGGGVVIQAAGSTLGAVGVSGASGGDKDEACAKAGLAAVQDKLEF